MFKHSNTQVPQNKLIISIEFHPTYMLNAYAMLLKTPIQFENKFDSPFRLAQSAKHFKNRFEN